MTDPLLLNYHDACVYRSDLRLVESPTEWLNDACINFRMTQLQQRQNCKSDDDNKANLLFLDPSVVSYMMHQCDEEDLTALSQAWIADLKRQAHENNSKRYGLLIPINDHHSANSQAFQTVGGGNHWSLLVAVLSKSDNGSKIIPEKILHFDSHRNCNAQAAVAVAAKISEAFQVDKSTIPPTHCRTPQQNNGYDCGIFALAAAEALSDESLWSDGVAETNMEESLQSFIANNGGGKDFAKLLRRNISADIRNIFAKSNGS